MASIGSETKQSREIIPIDIDYSKAIGDRAVDSIATSVEIPNGMTLNSQQISGNVLQLYVAGGTDGMVYKWTVLTDITLGGRLMRLEDEFMILVTDT